MNKHVFMFDDTDANGKELLGGKGANLAEMTRIGLPVPYGFTISTKACNAFYEAGEQLPADVKKQVDTALEKLETTTGKGLGDTKNPLLVSVRSGAVFSMPGMMDTVLNLGMNDETVVSMAELTGEPRFAYDSYRRFIQMFSDVVLGVDSEKFERKIETHKQLHGFSADPDLSASDWKTLIKQFQTIVEQETGRAFPQDPREQMILAIQAVFGSWNNDRAQLYRKWHGIPGHLGTAVNIQSMVFGNTGNDSGTGVAFSRNPSTGESKLYGEYLINAQGEDVVAGIRTPQAIETLRDSMPDVYQTFAETCRRLENHYRDMQDIEFTIERGNLFILQTRNGKRTAEASVRIAVDMHEEGILTKDEALMRVDPEQLGQLLHRRIDETSSFEVLAKGLPASPGAATGKVVFSADDAEDKKAAGVPVILVRPETTPDDIHGIIAAEAVVTTRGGMTSHAAVVARGMGKACISGCSDVSIDLANQTFAVGNTEVAYLDTVTINGGTGELMLGELTMADPELSDEFHRLLSWADDRRHLGIRTNSDTPDDAARALSFGAEGIGLCRTEHMFMDPERIPVVREMILASTSADRQQALDRLLPMQADDFRGIFETMGSRPVTIRLLDPPLHEFLPDKEELIKETAQLEITDPASSELKTKKELLREVRRLDESNPMLGHRGCRLAMVYPEIYAMQVEAIIHAAIDRAADGAAVRPEIMIPLVGHVNELKAMRRLVKESADRVLNETGEYVAYTIGTMIEVPRAALTADAIAAEADFFSFGTNDLTQTTFGYSRDDAENKFLQRYIDDETLANNPFMVLDSEGVGELVKIGVEKGRRVKEQLKTGICGEHGGETSSIAFCHAQRLDYVSCSPYRVPLARLAAAQAAVVEQTGTAKEKMNV
ncbi:pyruvate, phosphate dikinase [Salisediminibacterium halotolerans]|uniref:pyruvate, phosphate dikinase n=1 Tax=Salisediminibacterium halotolerans TaxID=517425 RepID=UPI000EB03FFB|nr:pyruvate, phosphate dikinase [Salisediminibacterium halotolerans]RLJ71730.1 pyruvate phosphate dikinase [Actinophytocola xinjiangensis]RPE86880.1 pyruvate phosphate dikinase [Salisediminibacterium halotolerans]TWG32943.1 pyruvate phosphate dikinase [Salisediminibacterium halotolerans]GEL08209.1 pyruvate, phosphate dikinase [Salisediminibacterium halotolerans]